VLKYLLTSSLAIGLLGGCSSTPSAKLDQGQYCHTSSRTELSNGTTVNSNTVVECSDKPKVNHFVKDVGMAKQCRPYQKTITIQGREKNVQGFLCQFADGSWQAVDGRYRY